MFLHWVLAGGHGPYGADDVVLERGADGAVRGIISFGAQLVLAADDDAVLDTFANAARRHPYLRSFVGPKPAVDGLWDRVRSWHRAPTLVRDRQPLYMLAPDALAAVEPVEVRPARVAEAALVAEHSARMIAGELGYDPREGRSGFVSGIRRAIELGWWWVWIVDGELRFQCNVGARSPATIQIQGVWTPPAQRGNGYATRGLAAIARRLLTSNATLSLYVNAFNTDAISLYERLGFVQAGELATYLFP